MSAVGVTQVFAKARVALADTGAWLGVLNGSMLVLTNGCFKRRATPQLIPAKSMLLRLATTPRRRPSPQQLIMDHISDKTRVVEHIDTEAGTPRYVSAIKQHRSVTQGQEEWTRALFLVDLVYKRGYAPEQIELEKCFKVNGSEHRVDVILNRPCGKAFLCAEVKDSLEDRDRVMKEQLFPYLSLSKAEYGLLVTHRIDSEGSPKPETMLVSANSSSAPYDYWVSSGRTLLGDVPSGYGDPIQKAYGNVPHATELLRPLDTDVSMGELQKAQRNIHNLLWGGGGAAYHDVYRVMLELLLCRIHDEQSTAPGERYDFQPLPGEDASMTVERLRCLCKTAAKEIEANIESPFGSLKASPQKLCDAVRYLHSFSFTRNKAFSDHVDVAGDFFEQTVGSEFKQGKGQFFTHRSIASFLLRLSGLDDGAKTLSDLKDARWPPRIIDPSCGSGTFLIEAIRLVGEGARKIPKKQLTQKQEEKLEQVLASTSTRQWTEGCVFGADSHQDLHLGCKVNLLAHLASTRDIHCCDTLSQDFVQAIREDRMGTFDMVVSNPPFSVTLSKEEKHNLTKDYALLQDSPTVASEHLFLERWFQLLREGGTLIAVVPETLCASASKHASARKFLFKHFNLQAVVALPSEAFRPFTGTRTVVVLAQKKTTVERALLDENNGDVRASLAQSTGRVFMAEPEMVGYKRRTGKPDLVLPDDLTGGKGSVLAIHDDLTGCEESDLAIPDDVTGREESVLACWKGGYQEDQPASRRFGFWVSLVDVAASSESLRCDPKYLWRKGICESHIFPPPPFGESTSQTSSNSSTASGTKSNDPEFCLLSDLMTKCGSAPKLAKGQLDEVREQVAVPNKLSLEEVTHVDELTGLCEELSDADICIHSISLTVLRNNPDARWIGVSGRWLRFKINPEAVADVDYIRYLLLTTEVQQACQDISSGMTIPCINAEELLALRVPHRTRAEQLHIAKQGREELDAIRLAREKEKAWLGGLSSHFR